MKLNVLLLLACCFGIRRSQGQLGVTTCTFATQSNCPNFLPNSRCDLGTLRCECPTVTGYVDDGSGIRCTYDCGALAAPVNGQVDTTQGTFTDDVATYICDATYKVNGAATSTCVADTGWDNTGTTCISVEIGDDCSTNMFHCSNIANAVCQNFATCGCNAGYEDDGTGLACTEINECITIAPCQNGGTCTDLINDYSCACVAGYEGKECQTNIDECASNPCQNGGVCTDAINSFTCACTAGYEDDTCSTNINDCSPNPCQNEGVCLDGVNDYICTCQAGYEGKDCDTNIDECATHQCENGATCVDGINQYTCTCVAGYNGNLCQNNIDECLTHACQNGATCVDGINDYSCLCVAGYNGEFCQNNIDECETNACANGATCIDAINSYSCACVSGYTDTYCLSNIDECLTHACQNGATCMDGINEYSCLCVPGYNGEFCQNNIDECETNACANGATCIDAVNSYSCVCVPGYTDTYCLSNIDECLTHTCQNGATCVDGINEYSCLCVPGYNGEFCQNNIDECETNVCANGATCIDAVNSYSCVCVPGYTDTYCLSNIDECADHQCQNGGLCVDGIDSYTCECVTGYAGLYCQSQIDGCETTPCENGGTCTDLVNGYICDCPGGFTGLTCRPGALGDDCSTRSNVCDNIDYAECDGSTCVCRTGYEDTTGVSGECTSVGCRTITPPVNGAVDHASEGTLYTSKAYFSCNDGYILEGVTSVTCLTDGTWDGETPTCSVKECPFLSNIQHGWVDQSSGRLEGSTAVYVCKTGYALVGVATRTCLSSKLWDGVQPECVFGSFPLVYGSLFVGVVVIGILIIGFCIYLKLYQRFKTNDEFDEHFNIAHVHQGSNHAFQNEKKQHGIKHPNPMKVSKVRVLKNPFQQRFQRPDFLKRVTSKKKTGRVGVSDGQMETDFNDRIDLHQLPTSSPQYGSVLEKDMADVTEENAHPVQLHSGTKRGYVNASSMSVTSLSTISDDDQLRDLPPVDNPILIKSPTEAGDEVTEAREFKRQENSKGKHVRGSRVKKTSKSMGTKF